MSAFVVSATHIATCAQIVTGDRLQVRRQPTQRREHPHGPSHGERHQRCLALRSGRREASNAGYVLQLSSPASAMPAGTPATPSCHRRSAIDVNEACCFDDGYTVSDYLDDCRSAAPSHLQPRRGLRVPLLPQLPVVRTARLGRQQGADVDSRIQLPISPAGWRSRSLANRRVWEARDPEPDPPFSRLISSLLRSPSPRRESRRGFSFFYRAPAHRLPSPWVLRFPPSIRASGKLPTHSSAKGGSPR